MTSSQGPRGDVMGRALAAYFRYSHGFPWEQPSQAASGVVEHDGKEYVVLRDTDRILAVYRVKNDGFLRQLRRWPRAIEE